MIVGGRPESRGVVAACSYEARKYGIHSAMPSSACLQALPQGSVRAPEDCAVSYGVRTDSRRFSGNTPNLVEPLSLDEAYLDVTHSTEHSGSATPHCRGH